MHVLPFFPSCLGAFNETRCLKKGLDAAGAGGGAGSLLPGGPDGDLNMIYDRDISSIGYIYIYNII